MTDLIEPVSGLLKQADQTSHSTRFQPGQSGNPRGRPRGSRNRLSEAFVAVLADDFEVHGVSAIERVRGESPATYLKIVASVVGRNPDVLAPSGLDGFTDEDVQAVMSHILREISDGMDVLPHRESRTS